MKTLVVVPAYNEAQVISQTLKELKPVCKKIEADLLVVNDGSTDKTREVALKEKVLVVSHSVNRGLGGAIGTGIEFARIYNYDLAVTIDADGQHLPEDIFKAIDPIIEDSADVVIGSRFMNKKLELPPDRKFLIQMSNWLTYLLFQQKTTDSLSGFRAFNRKAIEIKRLDLRLTEVPITVLYTDYSITKGQKRSNSINIVWKLFVRLFR